MRPIGLHVRLKSGLADVLQAVDELALNVVQSFLITESNKYASLSDKLIDRFTKAKKQQDFLYFVHAAYWSGLHDIKSKMFTSLKQEMSIAQDLQSDGIVVHIGAGKAGMSQKDKALYVAESINELSIVHPQVKLILENSPHAGRNFGGNIDDFAVLMEHVEDKSFINFCVDTAHAFVFGYNLANQRKLDDFLHQIDSIFEPSNMALLHFNDAVDKCGSYIDKHEVPGEGLIGKNALQHCMKSQLFKDLPIIIELSSSCQDSYPSILDTVKSWDY